LVLKSSSSPVGSVHNQGFVQLMVEAFCKKGKKISL